ncbi:hypothetical protein Tco_0974715 [Tanacetum coccineum]|uniref:Gag-Pol polyprotein n=1 Tax=Tanacetum coccineum TaxID=301880 RepID=A0ABQ5ECE8_9ASTR
MTDPAWIESLQEELLQFKRLDVWVLVPAPDNIKPLTLKWLFNKKHDEENTHIDTRLVWVVRGYHPLPEEGKISNRNLRFGTDDNDISVVQSNVELLSLVYKPKVYPTLISNLMKKPLQNFHDGGNDVLPRGLWYTKDSGFELTGFSDADYAGCKTPSRVLPVELNS